MKTKSQIIKSILDQVNPLKRRDVKILVNVYANFEEGNAIDKESKLELHKEPIREISPSYFKGNHTFDVCVYEVIDRKRGSFDLMDVVSFYPNHGATPKLKIQDFRDVFGYTYGRIEIHTVELQTHENGSVSVLSYQDEFNGRQLSKIPQNTPLMVQLHILKDPFYGYYELYDDALMIIDGGELKEYKNEIDHQTEPDISLKEEIQGLIVKAFSNSKRCFLPLTTLLQCWDPIRYTWDYVLCPLSQFPQNKKIEFRVVYYYMMDTPLQEVRVSDPLSFIFFEGGKLKNKNRELNIMYRKHQGRSYIHQTVEY